MPVVAHALSHHIEMEAVRQIVTVSLIHALMELMGHLAALVDTRRILVEAMLIFFFGHAS